MSPRMPERPRAGTDAPCDHCRKKNAVKSYRLNPHNWQPTYRLLCPACRTKLGYAPVDHNRPYAAAVMGMSA